MSLLASHQSHMNITESRRHAVKLMTRHTGLAYFFNGIKVAKCRALSQIRSGMYDGFYYGIDWTDAKTVNISSHNANNFLHKIGV